MAISPTLLITNKIDPELESVLAAWIRTGRPYKRLGKYWIKDEQLVDKPITIYGSQTFSLIVSQLYGVELISPEDSFIPELPETWTKRKVLLKDLEALDESSFPAFIKSLVPKLFPAKIYASLQDFERTTFQLLPDEKVLISTIVDDIGAEARCFVLNGEVKDLAFYEGHANPDECMVFAREFIRANQQQLPKTFVLDIAFSLKSGWFVLELNASWGAGLNNCKAENIIDCIAAATLNK